MRISTLSAQSAKIQNIFLLNECPMLDIVKIQAVRQSAYPLSSSRVRQVVEKR
jgi:hypothetical protein